MDVDLKARDNGLGGDSFLISTTTLRAKIENHIKREGVTLHQFSGISGVNVGTISGILNGNRSISIGQLDRITAAMGLPEGELYELYVEDCFAFQAPHWRRLKPFLLRCAELKRHDCISGILNRLLEDLKQVPGIFEAAELMFAQGWKEAAVILYESVIECERSSHSERLAMSYYRIFQILKNDGRRGFKAALQFLPYRYRLPEALALEGLSMLIQIYAFRFNWTEVENYADELIKLAWTFYEKKVWKQPDFKPVRPLVFYYGRAFLFKSGSYEYRGMYEEAKKWIAEYADLSWFEWQDDEARAEVEQLKMFAKANYLCLDIKSGNQLRIPEYVSFLEAHPGEIVEGLITLIESANRYDFYIDEVLDKFSEEIEVYRRFGEEHWQARDALEMDYSKEPPYFFRYAVFFQNYAVYLFRKGSYEEGLNNILHSMKMSLQISSKDIFVNIAMVIFELHRQFSTEEQNQEYIKLCRRLWENEKEHVLVGFGYSNA
ncbi:helix-turn-helix domain-containing protein [Paenibacillus sp. alder61]|uniref:helix-turn-helix domain-containing protein n=1 Tax=Paenibacillus sp. alder61 TaxID=2862948 RepID=UPI001CD6438A|nr:helix-turn-helix transcriptional regulator [Paenibacillus sp. alder61]MCA1294840.1 helix-turn-helix domain-containing protein [Paenibacillus sp. alder61]